MSFVGWEGRASSLNLLCGIWLFYPFMFPIHNKYKSVIVKNSNGRLKEMHNFLSTAIDNIESRNMFKVLTFKIICYTKSEEHFWVPAMWKHNAILQWIPLNWSGNKQSIVAKHILIFLGRS